MSQKHLITEEFIEGILGELSSIVIPYQKRCSPIYREYKEHYHSSCLCLKKYDLRGSYSSVTDAFIDYEELINDYYLAQGFLSAAGDLLKQIVKTAGLKQIPGHADKEQKLIQVCQSFIKELPPEAREEVNKQFERRKRAIEDSQEYYYYLAGYEIMVTLQAALPGRGILDCWSPPCMGCYRALAMRKPIPRRNSVPPALPSPSRKTTRFWMGM